MKWFALTICASTLVFSGCAAVKGPASDAPTASFKSESAKSFVAGYQPSDIKVIDASSSESVPAACTIDSSKYSLSFSAPAKVNLPAYSEGAVPATLRCEYEGQTYQQAFAPINLSKRARTNSAIGVAVLCPICGIGVAAGNSGEKTGDIFGFTEMELKIEQSPEEAAS